MSDDKIKYKHKLYQYKENIKEAEAVAWAFTIVKFRRVSTGNNSSKFLLSIILKIEFVNLKI